MMKDRLVAALAELSNKAAKDITAEEWEGEKPGSSVVVSAVLRERDE